MNTSLSAANHFARLGLMICAGALLPLLMAFDSYKVPFEQLTRDPKLQAEIRKQLGAGRVGDVYGDHYQITRSCLAAVGVVPAITEQISRKASDIDIDNWRNKSHYEAKNHCDRAIGRSSTQAFDACLMYHRQRIAEAWWALRTKNIQAFVTALPRALHVQQDFFAHSNVVDEEMTSDLQSISTCWTTYPIFNVSVSDHENEQRLWNDGRCTGGEQAWTDRLKLTGFDPAAADPYSPQGDPYSHRTFAKDNPTYSSDASASAPTGVTKYVAALQSASEACIATMKSFRALCESDELCRSRDSPVFEAKE